MPLSKPLQPPKPSVPPPVARPKSLPPPAPIPAPQAAGTPPSLPPPRPAHSNKPSTIPPPRPAHSARPAQSTRPAQPTRPAQSTRPAPSVPASTQVSGVRATTKLPLPSVPPPVPLQRASVPQASTAPTNPGTAPTNPSTAPTNPLPTNPLPLFVDAVAQHAPAPEAQAAAANFEHQYYVKQNESVRTLGADQIRLEVASGGVRPDALICKVGDTEWRAIRDAGAIGLSLPSLQPSRAPNPVAVHVSTLDEPNPFATRRSGGALSRLAQVKNKGTLIAWALSLSIGLTIVLQRNGTLYSMAEGWGLVDGYEAFEKSVFGGPGEGTARSARRLLGEFVPTGLTPFAEVEARVTVQGRSATKGAD